MLILPLIVKVDVSESRFAIAGGGGGRRYEMINDSRCDDALPYPGITRAEKCLRLVFLPGLEPSIVKQPLACPGLSAGRVVGLPCGVIDRREPGEYLLFLFALMVLNYPCDLGVDFLDVLQDVSANV